MTSQPNSEWRCPEADANGFVPLEVLGERARELDREAFVERYPVPALVVLYHERDSDGEYLNPLDSGVQLLTMSIKSTAILKYLHQVTFVTKRPGNLYAHLISIGRSAGNDISIAVETLSKLHGYFVREDEGWSFIDHGSTNGSKLDDKPLEAGVNHRLEDGDVLQLGLEVAMQFLLPETLYDTARRAR